MKNALDAVLTFKSLLTKEYEIILGRKGITVSLTLKFDKSDCFHLMGLHYLTDVAILKRKRALVYDDIEAGKITIDQLEASVFYSKIKHRINLISFLENILDSDGIIFKYNQKNGNYSKIQADYLLQHNFDDVVIYLFISKNAYGKYFCRSFFPKEKRDYAINQPKWTVLLKKKRDTITNKETILYNRLP